MPARWPPRSTASWDLRSQRCACLAHGEALERLLAGLAALGVGGPVVARGHRGTRERARGERAGDRYAESAADPRGAAGCVCIGLDLLGPGLVDGA